MNKKEKKQRALYERTLVIRGHHAYIHEQLIQTAIFANNHEIAEFAATVGILFGEVDDENLDFDKEFKIQKETMRDSGEDIIRLYRFCMLLDDLRLDKSEAIERAFGYDDRGDEAEEFEKILEGYMRGGYNVLEEQILKKGTKNPKNMGLSDFLKNEYDFLNLIDEEMIKLIQNINNQKPMSNDDILRNAMEEF